MKFIVPATILCALTALSPSVYAGENAENSIANYEVQIGEGSSAKSQSPQFSIATSTAIGYLDYALDLNQEREDKYYDLTVARLDPKRNAELALSLVADIADPIVASNSPQLYTYALDLQYIQYTGETTDGFYWSVLARLAYQKGSTADIFNTNPDTIEYHTRFGLAAGAGYRADFAERWHFRIGFHFGRYFDSVDYYDEGWTPSENTIDRYDILYFAYEF